MPVPLLPALPWVGKALLGLGATLGLYPAIKKTTESAREYVQSTDFPSFNRSSTKSSSSGPAVATYEPDNHTNVLVTRPVNPYIGEEAAPISALTRTNNWDDDYWSRPSSTLENYGDFDYITGDIPVAPAPKGDDDNNKKDNNNNNNNKNNKNRNYTPWLIGSGLLYAGWQGYEGYKEREALKENEEIAKENEQSAEQLGESAGKSFKRINKNPTDSVSGTPTTTPVSKRKKSNNTGKPNNTNKSRNTNNFDDVNLGGGWGQ